MIGSREGDLLQVERDLGMGGDRREGEVKGLRSNTDLYRCPRKNVLIMEGKRELRKQITLSNNSNK